MLGRGRRSIERARQAIEPRSQQWRALGLGAELDRRQVNRALGQVVVLTLLAAGVLIVYGERQELFPGLGTEVRVATVVALVIIGWGLARAAGRGVAPAALRRMDPGTAGTVGFVVRLLTMALIVLIALRIAGVRPGTLAAGGAVTAVIIGLAAQQTIGNVFAGVVLLSTRPFQVGERVRVIGGWVGGETEGTVGSLGLFYTTLVDGTERMLIPNSVLLNMAVVPLHYPERVELRARLDAGLTPGEVEERLERGISVPVRFPPHVTLEELDRDEVVVRILATPEHRVDKSRLAAEIIAAVRESGGQANGAPQADTGVEAPAAD